MVTIQIDDKIKALLDRLKVQNREDYKDVIERLASKVIKREKNQYDEFLHTVQQRKMRELWDNKEDTEWEHA